MKIITETERLIIREILPTDINEMFELHSDPEVHIYLGNETITSKEKMVEGINFIRQQYLDYGVGRNTSIKHQHKNYSIRKWGKTS